MFYFFFLHLIKSFRRFILELANYFYDTNPTTKAPKLEPLQKETVPYYLKRLDKIVEENGGYFVGGQVRVTTIF